MDEVVGIVFGSLMVVVIIMCGANWLAGVSCADKGKAMGFESSYSITADCMIKVHDQWVPMGSYKVIQ